MSSPRSERNEAASSSTETGVCVAADLDAAFETAQQLVVVVEVARDFGERVDHARIFGGVAERAQPPAAGALGAGELVELQSPGFDRDLGSLRRARGGLEAALEQRDEQAPLPGLARDRAQPVGSRRAARVVRQRAPVELGRALGLGERSRAQRGQRG